MFWGTRVLARSSNIVFYYSNGSKTFFTFADHPKLTYQDDKIILTTVSNSIEFSVNDLLKITFEETSTKVQNLLVTSIGEDRLYIYNMLGDLIKVCKADRQHQILFLTQDLPNGLYVIKGKNKTYKYYKK